MTEIAAMSMAWHQAATARQRVNVTAHRAAPDAPLRIALVNNMPDAALMRTEQQFKGLMERAADGQAVELTVYGLPSIARGEAGAAYFASRALPISRLWQDMPAAIIVTGAEPRYPDLRAEPMWESLAELLDRSEAHGIPCLLSCLAAHAAAQYIDRVPREPMEVKCFGVFDHIVSAGHARPHAAGCRMRLPHSHWNRVTEAALHDAGYEILSRSREAGVGFFAKRRRSLWLFCQGHPEYDETNLLREYRRDVSRFLKGERATYPELPRHYFAPRDEWALNAFRTQVLARPDASLLAAFPSVAPPDPEPEGQATALHIVGNWLAEAASAGIRAGPATAAASG